MQLIFLNEVLTNVNSVALEENLVSEKENDVGGFLSSLEGVSSTTVPDGYWDGLLERLSGSQGHLEGGRSEKSEQKERRTTLELLSGWTPDPEDKLGIVTKRHLERRVKKAFNRKKRPWNWTHHHTRNKKRKEAQLRKGERDMYTNWERIKSGNRLCHQWDISFEDWMDVMEFVSKKWGYEEPWLETRNWHFRGRGTGKLTIENLKIVEKGTGRVMFDSYEFRMWKDGYLLI